MGMQPRLVGMFRELFDFEDPRIRESIVGNVDDAPLPDAEQVVQYLQNGHVVLDVMDLDDDFFGSGDLIINAATMLSDGEWIWREDFRFYVKKYQVHVPDDFLNMIRLNDYQMPDCTAERLRECYDVISDIVLSKEPPPWETDPA